MGGVLLFVASVQKTEKKVDSSFFFFADIERNQVDAAGLALLRFLAAQGEGAVVSREALARHFPGELDNTIDLLLRRELIEPADGGYRFQVELIRRWFARQDEQAASSTRVLTRLHRQWGG
jgi:hypothetical protein